MALYLNEKEKKGGLFNFNYTISLVKEKVCYVSMVFLGIELRKVNVLQKQGLLLLKYIMFSPTLFTFVWNLYTKNEKHNFPKNKMLYVYVCVFVHIFREIKKNIKY